MPCSHCCLALLAIRKFSLISFIVRFSGLDSFCFFFGEDSRSESEEQQEAVALQTATMVDTVLLVARLNCTPPRRWDVVDLLSKPNRCHEASCLPLLAERGVPYAEALLWLYRSVGAHERVLQNLTEEKCVNVADPDSWGVEEFQRWTSQ